MMDLAQFTQTLNTYIVETCLLPPMTDEEARTEYATYVKQEERHASLHATE
jgi:hypothetical protein